MAYALVANTHFKGAPTGGITPPVDTTGANLIVINTSPNDVGGPTAPHDSFGNTYTLIISMNELQAYSQLWYCKNPIVGPLHTFSSSSGTTNFMGLSVAAFSGATTNPFNAAIGNDGHLPNPPFNGSMKADGQGTGLLPGAAGSLVICAQSSDIQSANAPGGFSINSGFTVTDTYFQEPFTCLSGGMAYQIQTTPTLVNPTWTANGWTGSGFMAVTMATFTAFTPPPPPNPTPWSDFEIWAMRASNLPHLPVTVGLAPASAGSSAASLTVSISSAATVLQAALLAGTAVASVSVQSSTNTSPVLPIVSAGSAASAIAVQKSPGLQIISAASSAASLTIITGSTVSLISASAVAGAANIATQITAVNVSLQSVSAGSSAASMSTSTILLTTLILNNTSGGMIAANTAGKSFGHIFKDGDITAGTYPQLKTSDGTAVSVSFGGERRYPSGSLKFISILPRYPSALTTSGDTYNIYNNGSAPSASGRTTANLDNSNIHCQVAVTVLDGPVAGEIGQTYTATVAQGIARGSAYILPFSDGPAGKTWIIKSQFVDGSNNPHGQLECWFYMTAHNNGSGNLAGVSVNAALCMPNYQVTSPLQGLRVFSSVVFSETVSAFSRDLFAAKNAQGNPSTFTWLGSGVNLGRNFQASGNVRYGAGNTAGRSMGGWATRLATTGVLPAPFATNVTYSMACVGTATNQFVLSQNFAQLLAGGPSTAIKATDGGAGTHTMTMYPSLNIGAVFYTADTDGEWDFFQAGGTQAARAPVHYTRNSAYWKSTKLLPPIDLGIVVSPVTAQSDYVVNGVGTGASGIDQSMGSTGEIPDLGVWSSQYAKHFVTQSVNDESVVKSLGLAHGGMQVRFRAPAQVGNGSTMPILNNTNYGTSLPAPTPNLRFYETSASWTGAPTANLVTIFPKLQGDHMPHWPCYPYLVTGRPEFLDQMLDQGNRAILNRVAGASPTPTTPVCLNATYPSRQFQINGIGPIRYAIMIGTPGNFRADVWDLLDWTNFAAFCPDSYHENPAMKTYAMDVLTENYQFMLDWRATFPQQAGSFAYDAGLFITTPPNPGIGSSVESGFMRNYMFMSMAQAVGATGLSQASDMLNFTLKMPKKIYDTSGNFGLAVDYWILPVRQGSLATDGWLTDQSQLLPALSLTCTWTSGGHFTFTQGSGYWFVPFSIQTGDYLEFPFADTINVPGGLPKYVFLYPVNVGAYGPNTCDLSTVQGDTSHIVTPTNTGTNGTTCYRWNIGSVPNNSMFGVDEQAYTAQRSAYLTWAKFLGMTIDDAVVNDANVRYQKLISNGSAVPGRNPKYTFTSSF